MQYITLKSGKKVRIEVLSSPKTRPKTYRETFIHINVSQTKRKSFVIYWHNETDFRSALNRVKRHYLFTNNDIIEVKTRTRKYANSTFVAKGFKP